MYLSPRAAILCMSFLTAIAGNSTAQAQAQAQAMIDKVKAVIATDAPRLEATFKDLHGHPELELPAVTLDAQINSVAALALLGSQP